MRRSPPPRNTTGLPTASSPARRPGPGSRILPYIEQENLANTYNIPNGTLGTAQAGLTTVIPMLLCPSDSTEAGSTANAWPNINGISMALINYKGVSGCNWGSNGTASAAPGFTTAFPVKDPDPTKTYDGLDHANGIFYRSDGSRKLRLTNITDGTSNTFMIGEDLYSFDWHCGGWAYPNYVNGTCAIPPNYADPGNNNQNWPNRYSFHSMHPGGVNFCLADGSVRFVSNGVDINTYYAMATIRGGETLDLVD